MSKTRNAMMGVVLVLATSTCQRIPCDPACASYAPIDLNRYGVIGRCGRTDHDENLCGPNCVFIDACAGGGLCRGTSLPFTHSCLCAAAGEPPPSGDPKNYVHPLTCPGGPSPVAVGGSSVGTPGLGHANSGIVDGTETSDWPAVGQLFVHAGSCTGTLVGPRTVITAAHCVEYTSSMMSGNYGTFIMRKADGSERKSIISEFQSIGTAPGKGDIAFVTLDKCAADFTSPMEIAKKPPAAHTQVTEVGYGCTKRCPPGSNDFKKRQASFGFGDGRAGCPGDSGGPFLLDSRFIVGVASEIFCETSDSDLPADPTPYWHNPVAAAESFPCDTVIDEVEFKTKVVVTAIIPYVQLSDGRQVGTSGNDQDCIFLMGHRASMRYRLLAPNKVEVLGLHPRPDNTLEFGRVGVNLDQKRVWLERPDDKITVEFETEGANASDPNVLKELMAHGGTKVFVSGKTLFHSAGGGTPGQVTRFSVKKWRAPTSLF